MTSDAVSSALDTESDENILGDLTICQICLTAPPMWRIPLTTDTDEDRTPWLVCSSCLAVVEENDAEVLAQHTLAGLNSRGGGTKTGSKAARKRTELSTYLTLRKMANQLLREINGDATPWRA